MEKTGERLIFAENWKTLEDYSMFLREFFVYDYSKNRIPLNSKVLELGFGEGFGSKILAEKASKVFALEVDPKAVSHAKQKYSFEKLSFSLYGGKEIPFDDNYFDAVISFQVIEHIKDDLNFVKEINRVAKKNALIFLSTVNAETRMVKTGNPWNEFHIREYSKKDFENLLNKAFNSVEVFGVNIHEDLFQAEMERIRKAVFLNSLDPFKFRKFLPDFLKSFARKIAKNLSGYEKKIFDSKKFSNKDLWLSKTELNKSLDLFAVCRK